MTRRIAIVGGGTAGLPAAIEALAAGAEVTLVEKAERLGGTLWLSGVYMSASQSAIHRAKGIDDTPEAHAADVQRIGRGLADETLLRLLTERAGETIDWLSALGTPFTDASPFHHTDHELYTVPRSFEVVAPAEYGIRKGRVLLDIFERELAGREKLTVMVSSRVVELLRDDVGVTGCRVDTPGGVVDIEADAVILATGGFASSQELLRRFHGRYERLLSSGVPGSTGDGLLLAEAAGAAIINAELVLPVPGGVEDPDLPGSVLPRTILTLGRPPAESGDIWVNLRGERFVREDSASPDERERAIAEQPDAVLVAVFDEPMRRGLTPAVVDWTRERFGEHPDPRVLRSAQTLAELAELLDLPVDALERTVGEYNASVERGIDPLGRTAMPKPIDEPPFHGVRTRGALGLTLPGVRIDDRSRVLDATGRAIPGLYAAGEVAGGGQFQGCGYSGGMMSTSAITLGRRAAEVATHA